MLLTPRHGRRSPLQDRLRVRAARRSAQGDRGARRRPRARRQAPGAARRHRLGQDVHRSRTSSQHVQQPDADHRAQQDARGAALRRVQGALPRATPSSTSSATTTTTSPRRTSRRRDTFIEKDSIINDEIDRMRHAATRALLVAARRHHRRVGVAASTASAIAETLPRPASSSSTSGRSCAATSCCAGWSTSSTSATTSTSTAARSACAATSSRSSRRTRRDRACASSSSATRSRRSARSIRCAARSSGKLERYAHLPRRRTTSRRARQLRTRDRGDPRRAARAARELSTSRASCSRSSASSSARMYDLEMLEQMGFCNGIENYSRHLSGRKPGEPPPTLIDYFPKDFLLIVDESHQTVPQIGAMYRGDRSRKETLVEYGFRLPSALDNRPLKFDEFEEHVEQAIYVSATPGDYELKKAKGVVVEQVIRPTGLHRSGDRGAPGRATRSTICSARSASASTKSERVLVTTLTKRMAEDLTEYYTRARRARALPALRHRHARAHRDHPRSARAASSTCSSASTCCARASTCPRCRWSRSSTPTRRASCAASARSSRRSAAPRAT